MKAIIESKIYGYPHAEFALMFDLCSSANSYPGPGKEIIHLYKL